MYIGIDLGTSGVKAILLNEQGEVWLRIPKSSPCRVRTAVVGTRSGALVAGDGPRDESVGAQHSLREVKALGIAGRCTARRCWISNSASCARILWNDGRCGEECALLEENVSRSRQITGNLMMPGFTAPKLLWVQRHEPEIFKQVDKVLLPKIICVCA
jgi:xylulokinase